MRIFKAGRVAIITRGSHFGKNVVFSSALDPGAKEHPYHHTLVTDIERYPSTATHRMSKIRQ